MTYRCLLQMVLLLCLSTTALSRSFNLLRFHQRRSSVVCQNLLWQLPSTPQHCLEFRMDFQMPEEMKQAQQFRKEDAVLVMYEMLQHIFNILTRDFSSTGWSDTIIEHLLEELYGQMNRLEPIRKEIMQKQNSTMGDTTDLHLRKYYFNLVQYLESKEYNRCAWTVVRVQILRNFSFLRRLTGYLRDWTSPPCGSGKGQCDFEVRLFSSRGSWSNWLCNALDFNGQLKTKLFFNWFMH